MRSLYLLSTYVVMTCAFAMLALLYLSTPNSGTLPLSIISNNQSAGAESAERIIHVFDDAHQFSLVLPEDSGNTFSLNDVGVAGLTVLYQSYEIANNSHSIAVPVPVQLVLLLIVLGGGIFYRLKSATKDCVTRHLERCEEINLNLDIFIYPIYFARPPNTDYGLK